MCNTLVHFMINRHRCVWFKIVEDISGGNNWIAKASKIKISVFKQKCPNVLSFLSQFDFALLGRIAPHQTRPYRPRDDLPDDQKSNSASSRLPKYHPPINELTDRFQARRSPAYFRSETDLDTISFQLRQFLSYCSGRCLKASISCVKN